MKYDKILIRPGELFLKGKNRILFERKLAENVRKIVGIKVKKLRFRLIADYFAEHQNLKRVFGITSYSPAVRVEKDLDHIKKAALKLVEKDTFKIETKRSDKTFPIKSPELNVLVGKYIEENSKAEFSFKDYQQKITIEINQDGAYLFTEAIPCFGGLPTGVEGKVLLFVEDKASLLAGLLIMKRGVSILPISFKKKSISLLQKYSPDELKLKSIKDFKGLEEFAEEKKISVLVIGRDLKKQARKFCSPKMKLAKFYAVNKGFYTLFTETKLTILKPLIAFSEKEIKEKLKKFSGV